MGTHQYPIEDIARVLTRYPLHHGWKAVLSEGSSLGQPVIIIDNAITHWQVPVFQVSAGIETAVFNAARSGLTDGASSKNRLRALADLYACDPLFTGRDTIQLTFEMLLWLQSREPLRFRMEFDEIVGNPVGDAGSQWFRVVGGESVAHVALAIVEAMEGGRYLAFGRARVSPSVGRTDDELRNDAKAVMSRSIVFAEPPKVEPRLVQNEARSDDRYSFQEMGRLRAMLPGPHNWMVEVTAADWKTALVVSSLGYKFKMSLVDSGLADDGLAERLFLGAESAILERASSDRAAHLCQLHDSRLANEVPKLKKGYQALEALLKGFSSPMPQWFTEPLKTVPVFKQDERIDKVAIARVDAAPMKLPSKSIIWKDVGYGISSVAANMASIPADTLKAGDVVRVSATLSDSEVKRINESGHPIKDLRLDHAIVDDVLSPLSLHSDSVSQSYVDQMQSYADQIKKLTEWLTPTWNDLWPASALDAYMNPPSEGERMAAFFAKSEHEPKPAVNNAPVVSREQFMFGGLNVECTVTGVEKKQYNAGGLTLTIFADSAHVVCHRDQSVCDGHNALSAMHRMSRARKLSRVDQAALDAFIFHGLRFEEDQALMLAMKVKSAPVAKLNIMDEMDLLPDA